MIPLRDLLLVRPSKEQLTVSGIILPKDEVYNTGEVLVAGDKAIAAKSGDTIKYYRQKGTPINYRGEDLLLLSESEEVVSIL